MTKIRYGVGLSLAFLSLGFFGISPKSSTAAELNTQGSKGAKVYCYMRGTGNPHEVSWNASYSLLKRQANSMFKTSPKHAAVMITEAIVEEPEKYPNCGQYLGDLFGGPKTPQLVTNSDSISSQPIQESQDRYTY